MLSGFISQWRMPQFFRCFKAIKSCFPYALTAVSLRPILRPNFFKTSRRFIWRESKTKQRWFLYLKFEIKRMQWRLFSGSAPANFFNIWTSVWPALFLSHIQVIRPSQHYQTIGKGADSINFARDKMITYIVSLFRIIFMATSSGSPVPDFRSFARTTVEKTPFPWAAVTSYRASSNSPNR